MQNRWTWTTMAIVLATVAIVFAPVFVPREISRWYLAAAANAYRAKDTTLAEHYLARSVAWDPTIVDDGDYWIAQLSNSEWNDIDERLDLLAKVIKADPRWAGHAIDMAAVFVEEGDFEHAIRALKMAYAKQPENGQILNSLAYFRSLAGIELEQALKDIQRAIELEGPLPELLDTHAWVLHRLGRDKEALPIINQAVAGAEKRLGQTKPPDADDSPTAQLPPEKSSDDSQPARGLSKQAVRDEIEAAQTRLGQDLWNLAVCRFHRLRIYEALGEPHKGEEDRKWLNDHDVPIVDELY